MTLDQRHELERELALRNNITRNLVGSWRRWGGVHLFRIEIIHRFGEYLSALQFRYYHIHYVPMRKCIVLQGYLQVGSSYNFSE